MKKNIEKMIDAALKEEPDFQLSSDFPDQVILSLRKMEAANQRELYFWVVLGTMVILGCGAVIIALFLPAFSIQMLPLESADKVVLLAVAIGCTIGVIQYLDQKLVKNKMLGW